jgi:AmiR/NasT family two-component response regulator
MLESLLKSMLPADFDMNAYIVKGQQAMQAAVSTAQGVFRIEQKLDAELVNLRERVAALESVHQTNGVSNDNGSERDGKSA